MGRRRSVSQGGSSRGTQDGGRVSFRSPHGNAADEVIAKRACRDRQEPRSLQHAPQTLQPPPASHLCAACATRAHFSLTQLMHAAGS
jgi:hypothetical protein